MINNKRMISLLLGATALTMTITSQAGSPVWTFTPLTPTTLSVSSNSSAIVQYQVTNQSPAPHTLMMVPITGITQMTTAGNCSNPFTLSTSNPSCRLTLLITGNALNSDISGGPKVCQQGPDGNPSSLQCYQPSQNDLLNITHSPARYAYVTNFVGNTVSKCAVDSITGTLSNCIATGSDFITPIGIAFNNGHAYVANAEINTVSKCTVDPTGAFINCGSTGSDFITPVGIAINNGYAYISNLNINTVSKCTVDPTGEFINCGSTGSGFNTPIGIVFNNGYAYITNLDRSIVSRCIVAPTTGELNHCLYTGSDFITPIGIAINNGYAYVTDAEINTVIQCKIEPTGTLSHCGPTESDFTIPFGIGFN